MLERMAHLWGRMSAGAQWLLGAVPGAARDMGWEGMRWSYILIAVLVVIGGVVNLVVAHGWTVWPIVAVAGMLLYLNEAADRNASGIPVLYVYALAGMAVLLWVAVVMALSVVNPLILWAGILGVGGYCARDWMLERQRHELVASRREGGLCVFCGEPASVDDGVCPNCGEDPDPDQSQAQRIRAVMANSNRSGNARQVLQGETLAQGAKRKEAALMAGRNRPGGSGGRPGGGGQRRR
jgi:hypothetical protein